MEELDVGGKPFVVTYSTVSKYSKFLTEILFSENYQYPVRNERNMPFLDLNSIIFEKVLNIMRNQGNIFVKSGWEHCSEHREILKQCKELGFSPTILPDSILCDSTMAYIHSIINSIPSEDFPFHSIKIELQLTLLELATRCHFSNESFTALLIHYIESLQFVKEKNILVTLSSNAYELEIIFIQIDEISVKSIKKQRKDYNESSFIAVGNATLSQSTKFIAAVIEAF